MTKVSTSSQAKKEMKTVSNLRILYMISCAIILIYFATVTEQSAALQLEKAAAAALKRKTIQNLSVRALTRNSVISQVSIRNMAEAATESLPEQATASSHPFTPPPKPIDPRVVEAKVDVAVNVTANLIEKKVKESFLQGGRMSPEVVEHAVKDLLLRSEVSGEPAPPRNSSLHKLADNVGFLLMHGEEETEILVEVILEAIESYLDGYSDEAASLIVESEEFCRLPAELEFVDAFHAKLESGVDFTMEAGEISNKLNSMLSIMEALAVQTPSLLSHRASPAPQGGSQSHRVSRGPTPNGSLSSRPTSRGPTPEQIESLKHSLHDNRVKRLQDRESVHQLTAQMKEEVAAAIASALVSAALESVDIATQTDAPDVVVVVAPPADPPTPATTAAEMFPAAADTKTESAVECAKRQEDSLQAANSAMEPHLDTIDAGNTFNTILAALPPGQ